ncbi:MAG: DUF885 domain-containing protein, partial [Actinomycetes bacterium]
MTLDPAPVPDRPREGPRLVDALADRYVTECTTRYPEIATALGVAGGDDARSDYSPDGHASRLAHLRRTLADLRETPTIDAREHTAKEAMLERLGTEVELHEARVIPSRVSVVAGAAQEIRETFDLMPTDGEEAWANIAARLRGLRAALDGVRRTLAVEAAQGNVSALRQVSGTIEQIRSWTGQTGSDDFFAGLAASAPADLPDVLRTEVAGAAEQGRAAYADFGVWLGSWLAPRAPTLDAVGGERYALDSRSFLGAAVDLEETYAWGFEELHRIQGEQRALARHLVGSDDIWAAYEALDADPARRIEGVEGFRTWMQKVTDAAIGDLSGTHFDIPEPIATIECCLAPTHEGLIYYTGPTEDFSRPGRMWWAVPEGVDTFSTWKELTTVYHEGVPGHHLQIAQNAYR